MSGTYNRKDRLYQKAKTEGYRSRAAYKLQELDGRFKLLKPGARVADLGAAPGGWLQVAAEKIGAKDSVLVGVDLEEIPPIPGAQTLQGDFTEEAVRDEIVKLCGGKLDLVLSDMSPKLSGIRFRDACFSAELASLALQFACEMLKPGGKLVAKIFPGPEADELFKELRKFFAKAERVNLDSSRKTSSEYYLVGLGFK